ncbi:MAG: YggS family pyridoxal phosphate-dependent enzyme, partial [Burkholderiaceae bacterium]
ALFAQWQQRGWPVDTLSMGMSDDLEDAIACGATMVRVGSAIFGHRPVPEPRVR